MQAAIARGWSAVLMHFRGCSEETNRLPRSYHSGETEDAKFVIEFLRNQLLLALTEDDRLHGAEVQRLWNLVKDDLQPDRLWTVALDAIADFSARQGFRQQDLH